MRIAALVGLAFLAGIAHSQAARFDVLVKGKKAGVATYQITPGKAGGRATQFRIVLADGSITESISQSDRTGAAVSAENSVRRGTARTVEVVAYDALGNATITTNKGKPVAVPFDKKGGRKDPSELWFRTIKPSPGTWAVFRALDPRKRVWEEVKVTYVGKRDMGNLVRQERNGRTTNFTLDDRGIPLVIEAGALRLVRR